MDKRTNREGSKGQAKKLFGLLSNSLLKSSGDWAKEYINTNVPKVLDNWTKPLLSKLKSDDNTHDLSDYEIAVFKSLLDQVLEDVEPAMETCFLSGKKFGEQNMKNSIMQAMENSGLEKDKIKVIMYDSTEYLITNEEVLAMKREKEKKLDNPE